MGLNHGAKIISDGLVLCLDAANIKSFRGEPTTNYVYRENARVDSSYSTIDLSSYGGTMVANHPGIIRIYNIDGTELSAIYYNGGVTDPTNSQHAYWIYDQVLKKPVVQMIDKTGSWQAKSYNCGMNAWSTYGYTTGTQYTISWMQWVTNTSKAANVGMYTSNGATTNFFDGTSSFSSTSLNTKANIWERVYHTFTVTTNWDQTIAYNYIYMYGMYGGNYTIRIADVQLEIKDHPSHFCNGLTRGSTFVTGGGWRDLSGNGNHGELISNPLFNNSNLGNVVFDGIADYINIPSFTNKPLDQITCEAWIYPTKATTSGSIRGGAISCTNTMYLGIIDSIDGGNTFALHWANQTSVNRTQSWHGNIPNNQWSYIVGSYDGTISRAYINCVEVWNQSQTGSVSDGTYVIGTYGGLLQDGVHNFNGKLTYCNIYNKALSVAEITQNFNALKGRYLPLGSKNNPANSALDIKASNTSATDGVYWINLPTVGATQIYCIMNSAYDGGGWMLMMKATRGTTFNYDATYWTTNNTLNPTDLTLNDADAKYNVMNYYPAKDIMARFPDISEGGSIAGVGAWTWLENNFNRQVPIVPITFFNTVNRHFIKDAKTFSGWTSGVFSSQVDIRFYGFNWTDNKSARWGFGWNENGGGLYPNGAEGSDDVGGGIGLNAGSQNYSAGDYIGCCNDTTGINRSARVEVYIR